MDTLTNPIEMLNTLKSKKLAEIDYTGNSILSELTRYKYRPCTESAIQYITKLDALVKKRDGIPNIMPIDGRLLQQIRVEC